MITAVNARLPNVAIRIGSMFIDHMIQSIVFMIFSIPYFVITFVGAFNVGHESAAAAPAPQVFYYISMLGMSFYFCKDIFGGRSIAKRILRLQVINAKTGQPAGVLRCLVRDMFCIIWPVEGIFCLLTPDRRIGDRVAGTRLVTYERALHQPRKNIPMVFLAIILSYGFTLLISLPFKIISSRFTESNVVFIESSYNEAESNELEQLLAKELGQYLTADVRVYDQVKNKPLKYVSVILSLNDDYLANEVDYQNLKDLTLPVIYNRFPENRITGKLWFSYRSSVSRHSRMIFLGQ